jgi:hypothetical protein
MCDRARLDGAGGGVVFANLDTSFLCRICAPSWLMVEYSSNGFLCGPPRGEADNQLANWILQTRLLGS